VLFVAAAGPRLGFGHLVRCGALADALRTERRLLLRSGRAAEGTARAMGWSIESPAGGRAYLSSDLVVVDDPSPRVRQVMVRRVRQFGRPVATIHDLGVSGAASDLTINGSIVRLPGTRRADLEGPLFAILPKAVHTARVAASRRVSSRVLIALGGGAAVRELGPAIARRLHALSPDVRVDIAAGFSAEPRPELPTGCHWLIARSGLAGALSAATVAVVAGGITLYEACALGTPIVAVPVVEAQRPAIRAFAGRRAIRGVDTLDRGEAVEGVTSAVLGLLSDADERRRLSRRAAAIVDGKGASRVANRLRLLGLRNGARHAA
jgi:spore coat polysaccharide biosynthesis predicted glycosyltransferase SpsG